MNNRKITVKRNLFISSQKGTIVLRFPNLLWTLSIKENLLSMHVVPHRTTKFSSHIYQIGHTKCDVVLFCLTFPKVSDGDDV